MLFQVFTLLKPRLILKSDEGEPSNVIHNFCGVSHGVTKGGNCPEVNAKMSNLYNNKLRA